MILIYWFTQLTFFKKKVSMSKGRKVCLRGNSVSLAMKFAR